MDNNKASIARSDLRNQSRTINLDKSAISTNSFQRLNLVCNDQISLSKINENEINNPIDFNNKNNSEFNQQNQTMNYFILKRIIFSGVLLGILFYMNHFSDKKILSNSQKKSFTQDGCIIEIFSDEIYKTIWKYFIVNKSLKNISLTILYYFYDLIFFISCLYWILNIKRENWSFFFSTVILALFKYFSLEFFLMKNNEDILWQIPSFPFFLNIQNENRNENHFFSSSVTLFIVILKHLEENKLIKLKYITFIFLLLEIALSLFLRIQNVFGIIIGLILGLYLNKISNESSKVINHIYDFDYSNTNKQEISFELENKIKENIENMLRKNKYFELQNINQRNNI